MTKTLFAMFGATLLFTSGCANPSDDHVPGEVTTGTLRSNLFVLNPTLWPDPSNLAVCFEDAEYKGKPEREWVKSAVVGSWEANDAAVHFTGWGDCVEGAPGIHIVARSDADGPQTKGFGKEVDGVTGGMVLDFTFTSGDPTFLACTADAMRERCIRAIATHEMGHALGFLHEHERPDAATDCKDAQPQAPDPDTTLIGAYDILSIMNYCYPDRASVFPTILSPTDIKGLLQVYPPPAAAAPATNAAGSPATELPQELVGERSGADDAKSSNTKKSAASPRTELEDPEVASSGCSSAPGSRNASPPWLLFALGTMLVRRKRQMSAKVGTCAHERLTVNT